MMLNVKLTVHYKDSYILKRRFPNSRLRKKITDYTLKTHKNTENQISN